MVCGALTIKKIGLGFSALFVKTIRCNKEKDKVAESAGINFMKGLPSHD